jgi:hypothetical protein
MMGLENPRSPASVVEGRARASSRLQSATVAVFFDGQAA